MTKQQVISISNFNPILEAHYALSVLVDDWEQNGIRVDVGTEYSEDADVCILHHDRTVLQANELPITPKGVRQLNGEILDISKRSVSMLTVEKETIWDGPVIVKTNENHFGFPEQSDKQDEGKSNSLLYKLRDRLSQTKWQWARQLPAGQYPVLPSINDVPSWVWRSSEFVVEKFLPERTDNGMYAVRGWVFLGEEGYVYRNISESPVVKATSTQGYEYLTEVPLQLKSIRKDLKLDFGKIDFVQHGDDVYVFDVNKTPSLSVRGDSASVHLKKIAQGISTYL